MYSSISSFVSLILYITKLLLIFYKNPNSFLERVYQYYALSTFEFLLYFLKFLTKSAFHFYDKDISFVGPLESAATLGIMKTFKIYKPAPSSADFLEIQHLGQKFIKIVTDGIAKRVSAIQN